MGSQYLDAVWALTQYVHAYQFNVPVLFVGAVVGAALLGALYGITGSEVDWFHILSLVGWPTLLAVVIFVVGIGGPLAVAFYLTYLGMLELVQAMRARTIRRNKQE